MLFPGPGTGDEFDALLVLLGILTLSPLPWEPLVLQPCLWLLEAWSTLGYFPWEDGGCGHHNPSCPPGLPFRLLLDRLAVGFSTCTAGPVTETQRDAFKLPGACFLREGTFWVPLTPAGLQDSGQGVVPVTTQAVKLNVCFPHLFAFAHPIPCLERPCFFSPYSAPAVFHGLQQALLALPPLVPRYLLSAWWQDDVFSGSQFLLNKMGLQLQDKFIVDPSVLPSTPMSS